MNKLKVLLIGAILMLQGCFYQIVDNYEVGLAIEFCSDKSGLHSIRESSVGGTKFQCNDGSNMLENSYLKSKQEKS